MSMRVDCPDSTYIVRVCHGARKLENLVSAGSLCKFKPFPSWIFPIKYQHSADMLSDEILGNSCFALPWTNKFIFNFNISSVANAQTVYFRANSCNVIHQ